MSENETLLAALEAANAKADTQAQLITGLRSDVSKETEVRLQKLDKLEKIVLELKRYLLLLFAGLVLSLFGLGINFYIIQQNNHSTIERSKQATDQRNAQQELLTNLNDKINLTGRCAVLAKSNPAVYDNCVKAGQDQS